jgi:regulator of replication initiation timing
MLEAQAEKIEQLQGELQTFRAHLRHLRELLDDLRAENKQLKAALDERIQEQNEDAR